MLGKIFNIQKFSLHDGPGLRTTIFFKGCPLRCKWCCNPESQSIKEEIIYDERKCQKCLTCINICQNKAISFINNNIVINNEKCSTCKKCINNCLNKALAIKGENKTVDEIVKICLQDIDFYKESDGGVTFSGGECLLQKEFVEELIKELKTYEIHVACETTGYIKKENFIELAQLFDLIIYDIKHYDTKIHKLYTGVNNKIIIENLKYLIANNNKVLVRIPVIPKFNDSLDDVEGFAKLFKKLGVKEIQLLPFHQFGERKYDLLNREYTYKSYKAYYPKDLIDYRNTFIDKGIKCNF